MKLAYSLITGAVIMLGVYSGIRDYARSPAFHDLVSSGSTARPASSSIPATRAGARSSRASDAVPDREREADDRLNGGPSAKAPVERGGSVQDVLNEATDLYEQAREMHRKFMTDDASRDTLHEARKIVEEARTLIQGLPGDSSQVKRIKHKVLQLQNAIIKDLPI